MTKREIAKEIYRVEKPNMDETFFIKRMCDNYSKDVLLLILEEAKKERIKHINFWENIPDDCKKAISELQRLKVNNLCAWDHEENFGDVWWLVLHEVDLYAEGEFCKEVSRAGSMADPNAMSLAQAQRADRWLVKWNDLFNKYRTIGEGRFSENEFMYDGQLI